MNHAVTPTSASVGGLNDFGLQFHIERASLALMATGISAEPHKSAGVAFRQLVAIDHAADRFAFYLWG